MKLYQAIAHEGAIYRQMLGRNVLGEVMVRQEQIVKGLLNYLNRPLMEEPTLIDASDSFFDFSFIDGDHPERRKITVRVSATFSGFVLSIDYPYSSIHGYLRFILNREVSYN